MACLLDWYRYKITHMNNLDFFKACWNNEKLATVAMIEALPSDRLVYQPHPVNRTAREIVSHLLSHMVDFKTILQFNTCDETLAFDFMDSAMAAYQMDIFWKEVTDILNKTSIEAWENETVELLIDGKTFVTLPRSSMMWFFFFDVIHHRGQLSAYVRAMGGKNPVVYGYTADSK